MVKARVYECNGTPRLLDWRYALKLRITVFNWEKSKGTIASANDMKPQCNTWFKSGQYCHTQVKRLHKAWPDSLVRSLTDRILRLWRILLYFNGCLLKFFEHVMLSEFPSNTNGRRGSVYDWLFLRRTRTWKARSESWRFPKRSLRPS